MQKQVTHCLSFDIEEHFQVSAFASPMRRRHWDSFESRVEKNTRRLLSLLDEKGFRATFFILGWVAERRSSLIKEIASRGHEVASHGYSHDLITAQTPQGFREDVRKAKHILEDLIGAAVHGYRAPSFTITKDTLWALPVLVEEGYVYDSSIFPVLHDRYGIPGSDPWCHQRETTSGTIWEVPPSTIAIGGVTVPIAGGGYFRLIPYGVLKPLLRRVERRGKPLVLYFHPWEIDPEQPRMKGPLLSRVRHYMNLDKTEARLKRLVDDFQFSAIRESIEEIRIQCNGVKGSGHVGIVA